MTISTFAVSRAVARGRVAEFQVQEPEQGKQYAEAEYAEE
jgi:hypothetical protein